MNPRPIFHKRFHQVNRFGIEMAAKTARSFHFLESILKILKIRFISVRCSPGSTIVKLRFVNQYDLHHDVKSVRT